MRILLTAFFLITLSTNSFSTTRPGVDYFSLMNTQFYPETGTLLIGPLYLYFYNQADMQKVEIELVPRRGDALFKKDVYSDQWGDSQITAEIKPKGNGSVTMLEEGEYNLRVKIAGNVVTHMPFMLTKTTGGDAFNPEVTWQREGPWDKFAHISLDPKKLDKPVMFFWWDRESQSASSKKRTVHMIRNGEEVVSGTQLHVGSKGWTSYSRELFIKDKDGRNKKAYSNKDLVSKDGKVTFMVKSEGQTLSSFTATIEKGKLVHHAKSDFAFKPEFAFMAPKGMISQSREVNMLDTYWLDKD